MNYDMQCQLLAEGFKHEQIITEDEKLENELGERYAKGELTEKQMARILNAKTGMGPVLAKNRAYQITKRFESKKNNAVMKSNLEKSKVQLVKKNKEIQAAGKNTQRDYQRQWFGYGKSQLALPGGKRITLEQARDMLSKGLITEEVFTEGVKDVIVKKVLPVLMMAGYLTLGGKVVVDQANKSAALMQQVTDAEFNSGVYSFNFKGKNYEYNEKNNTVTIDGKTRKINAMDKIPPRQAKYSQERYGYMHEEANYFNY